MRNVLVVDDEKSMATLMAHALITLGFNVETASDGIEGIQKFDNGLFDLVITDLCMPGIDGNGLARHIRNSNKEFTPIIGMSGTPWLKENSYFDALLPKPFAIQTLVDIVRNLTNTTSDSATIV